MIQSGETFEGVVKISKGGWISDCFIFSYEELAIQVVKISKGGWISDCFIFSYEELAIQRLCLRYDSLDILHDAVGIIFLSARDTSRQGTFLVFHVNLKLFTLPDGLRSLYEAYLSPRRLSSQAKDNHAIVRCCLLFFLSEDLLLRLRCNRDSFQQSCHRTAIST